MRALFQKFAKTFGSLSPDLHTQRSGGDQGARAPIEALRQAAEQATAAKDWAKARERWEAILRASGARPQPIVYARLGQALRRDGQSDAASAILHKGLSSFPKDWRIRREFAELSTARRDWPEAVKRWEAVVNLSGAHARPEFYARLGEAHRAQGDFNAATEIVDRGLSVHSDSIQLRRAFAELASVQEDWPEAAKRWQTVLSFSSRNALASDYVEMSKALRHIGDHAAADAAAQRGIAIVASSYDALVATYQEGNELFQRRTYWLGQLVSAMKPGDRVLDLGCGSGVPVARELVSRGINVLGVDASEGQVAAARKNVPDADFRQADMNSIEFDPASFDAVTAFYSIIHVPRENHASLLCRISSWLKPGGIFVASLGAGDYPDRSKSWLAGIQMFFSHFDADTNKRLVADAGLIIDRSEVAKEECGGGQVLWILARKPADRHG